MTLNNIGQGRVTKCEKSLALKKNDLFKELVHNFQIVDTPLWTSGKGVEIPMDKDDAVNPDILKEVTSKNARCAECGLLAAENDYLCKLCRGVLSSYDA